MLTTPSGTPASVKISASIGAESGVSSAGLRTTLQPAVNAGASLMMALMVGPFHGMIAPATPAGS